MRFFPFLFAFRQKRIADCAARHADRTVHDRDIFFFCIQVCLFVAGIGIAFFRDNETGSHLDACAAKRQIVKDILMGVDASGKDDGDGTGIFSS